VGVIKVRLSARRARIEPVVTVTVTRLTALGVSGSGDITAEPPRTPRLTARIDGSGDIRPADLVADGLQIASSGSGAVSAAGQVGRLVLRIAGSGDVKAGTLRADDVSVSIAGSGDAHIPGPAHAGRLECRVWRCGLQRQRHRQAADRGQRNADPSLTLRCGWRLATAQRQVT